MFVSQPKLVALDSGHWVTLFSDAFSSDPRARREARQFTDTLLKAGYCVLLSGRHLTELLAVDDEKSARARLDFLREIEFMSWVDTNSGIWIGDITDVMAAEVVSALYEGGESTDVRRRVRSSVVRYGSIRDRLVDCQDLRALYQSWAQYSADRARTIESMSSFEFSSSVTTWGGF